MERNEFIKKALAGAAALFVANWGTLAEIRKYKDPEKPLLTEANLNRFFNNWDLRKRDGTLELAITDTSAFLEQNFSLSPQQQQTIRNMKPEDWTLIQSIITDAREDKGKLNFKFVNPTRGECRTEVRLMKSVKSGRDIANETEIRKHVVN